MNDFQALFCRDGLKFWAPSHEADSCLSSARSSWKKQKLGAAFWIICESILVHFFHPFACLTSICSYSLSQLLALHTSSFSHLPLVISPPAINAALPLSLSLPPALPVFFFAPSCYTRSPYFLASLFSLGMLFFSAFTSLTFITSAAVVSLSEPLFDSPLGSLALLFLCPATFSVPPSSHIFSFASFASSSFIHPASNFFFFSFLVFYTHLSLAFPRRTSPPTALFLSRRYTLPCHCSLCPPPPLLHILKCSALSLPQHCSGKAFLKYSAV